MSFSYIFFVYRNVGEVDFVVGSMGDKCWILNDRMILLSNVLYDVHLTESGFCVLDSCYVVVFAREMG